MTDRIYTVYRIDGPDGVYVGFTGGPPEGRWPHHRYVALREFQPSRSGLSRAIRRHGHEHFTIRAVWQSKDRLAALDVERDYARDLQLCGHALYNAVCQFRDNSASFPSKSDIGCDECPTCGRAYDGRSFNGAIHRSTIEAAP